MLLKARLLSDKEAGKLQLLIEAAVRSGVLPTELSGVAHEIRQRANVVLHHADREVPDPWQLLLHTRTIAEKVHARPAKR